MPKLAAKEVPTVDPDRPLPLRDLCYLCRDADRCLTRVRVKHAWDRAKDFEWLRLGAVSIVRRSQYESGRWILQARMDATDFEHDSAYVIRLPLVGLQLDSLAVHHHSTHLVAWVDSNDTDEFNVPEVGYDPARAKGSSTCRECDPSHRIVPSGCYVPKFDAELFERVRGKQLEIYIETLRSAPIV